jgi:hypothetical protein
MAFLQCLKEAITKHTTVDPESQVGKVLLRDKFLTQLAPDSFHRKRQRLVAKGDKMLDQLVQMAISVYYNQDLIKKREKDKSSPPNGDLMSDLPQCGQGRHFKQQCPQGGWSWRQPWSPSGTLPSL